MKRIIRVGIKYWKTSIKIGIWKIKRLVNWWSNKPIKNIIDGNLWVNARSINKRKENDCRYQKLKITNN